MPHRALAATEPAISLPTSFLQHTSQTTADGWIDFRQEKGAEPVNAASFATKFGPSLGLQRGYQLQLVKDKTNPKENRHQHYQHYWKDVLIECTHS